MNIYEWEYSAYKGNKKRWCREFLFYFFLSGAFLFLSFVLFWIWRPTLTETKREDARIFESKKDDFVFEEKAELPTCSEEKDCFVYYDIPFNKDMQDMVRLAAEESQIPFELALAVIWKETNFRNVIGDNGKSYGYMQIQERWHRDRMDKLGVTDLNDPMGNFRVGCDFLSELLDKYPLAYALTAYNRGKPGLSEYSEKVMDYMEYLVFENINLEESPLVCLGV